MENMFFSSMHKIFTKIDYTLRHKRINTFKNDNIETVFSEQEIKLETNTKDSLKINLENNILTAKQLKIQIRNQNGNYEKILNERQ